MLASMVFLTMCFTTKVSQVLDANLVHVQLNPVKMFEQDDGGGKTQIQKSAGCTKGSVA